MKNQRKTPSLFTFEVPARECGRLRSCFAPDFDDTSPLEVHTQQTWRLRCLLARTLEIGVSRLQTQTSRLRRKSKIRLISEEDHEQERCQLSAHDQLSPDR